MVCIAWRRGYWLRKASFQLVPAYILRLLGVSCSVRVNWLAASVLTVQIGSSVREAREQSEEVLLVLVQVKPC